MEPLTYEAIRRSPELLEELIRAARRQRAEAVWKLIVAALGALSRSPAAIATPRR